MQENFQNLRTRREDTSTAAPGDGSITELSLRLLEWMKTSGPAGSTDASEIAARIEAGLCELAGAKAATILVRRPPTDDLLLLATTSAAPEVLAAATETVPYFPASHLLVELPDQPQPIEQAEPHLQVFLGELWDFIRETLSTLIGTEHSPEANAPPAWLVPLYGTPPSSRRQEQNIAGIALLWFDSSSTLPPALRLALAAASRQAGDWLANALRLERLGRSYHQFARLVSRAVDSLSPEETRRGQAVAYYSSLISNEMGLTDREAERIEFAALLHGIGKIAVQDGLLQKPEPLSEEEREAVRLSLTMGADWLSQVEGLEEVAAIVRHQGERYDGGGYPDGLRGDAIPLGARVLAVALRFASMTNARSDRRAMSVVGGGLHSLHRESGGAFDPQVVEVFLRVMGRESEA